jgi:type IV pilus assembly protein PilW
MLTVRPRQTGLTIVELMVALVLGLILLGSTVQIFQSNRQTYRIGEALARVQENGRFAMQAIAHDLRMAGFIGCGSRRGPLNDPLTFQYNNVSGDAAYDELPANTIQVIDQDDGLASPAGLTVCDGAGADGVRCQASDAFVVVRGSENALTMLDNMADVSDTLTVRDGFADSDANAPFLVTDCLRGDLFLAVDPNDTEIQPNDDLQQAYSAGASVLPLVWSTYFVATQNGGDGIPSLYRRDNLAADPPVEIARGVEGMQILLGRDTDNDSFADTYISPDTAGIDWTEIVTLRVSLLVKSQNDFVTDTPAPIAFADGTIDPDTAMPGSTDVNAGDNPDRRLRMVFTTTVTLRNHLP